MSTGVNLTSRLGDATVLQSWWFDVINAFAGLVSLHVFNFMYAGRLFYRRMLGWAEGFRQGKNILTSNFHQTSLLGWKRTVPICTWGTSCNVLTFVPISRLDRFEWEKRSVHQLRSFHLTASFGCWCHGQSQAVKLLKGLKCKCLAECVYV